MTSTLSSISECLPLASEGGRLLGVRESVTTPALCSTGMLLIVEATPAANHLEKFVAELSTIKARTTGCGHT